MKAIILAAGYATRLYPLTKNQPKPLLEVAGKPILDYTVEKIEQVNEVAEIIIVTNNKFASHFEEWSKNSNYSKRITVVNDQTLSNEDRLGAIGDIQYVIEQEGIQDDLMILAGDSLFEFALTDFANYFEAAATDIIAAYPEELEQRQRGGSVDINSKGEVVDFKEKVENPGQYSVPAFYIFRNDTLPLLKTYLDEGNNPDAPGHFIPYLIKQKPVHAYIFEGYRYDIGTLDSYERAQKIFSNH